jgi:hypothetical protein
MAQVRAFSLGGIGSPCCCKSHNVTISTYWCGDAQCVAAGVITVTIKSGSCPGTTTVASGTADATGTFQTTLPPGTYCASASTTATGYSNAANTFTVPATGNVQAFSALYRTTLSFTDSVLGGRTLQSSGPIPSWAGTGSLSNTTYGVEAMVAYPACSVPGFSCAAGTADVFYFYRCNAVGSSNVTIAVRFSGVVPSCPDAAGTTFSSFTVVITGTGPTNGAGPCYPLSQTGTGTVAGSPTNPSPVSVVYGGCASDVNVTYTVTQ